jgi:CubicO group peptidase (beta-lactamase class C family)
MSDLVTDYHSTKIYNYISSHPLLRTPGTPPATKQEATAFYSTFAYGLAGIILERQIKQPLQNIYQNTIFQSLQMTLTTLNKIENITNRSYPHDDSGPITYSDLSGFAGGGNLRSNLNDLGKYVQAQIKASNINSLGQAILQSQNPTLQINLQDYYALGWEFYYTTYNKKLTFKGGTTPGFTAIITFDKNSEKAIIGLFNNYSSNRPGTTFFVLVNEYFK